MLDCRLAFGSTAGSTATNDTTKPTNHAMIASPIPHRSGVNPGTSGAPVPSGPITTQR